MCTAQHLEPDCHFAFSAYCQQFSFQTGKGVLYHFYGVSFGKRGATYLNGFGADGSKARVCPNVRGSAFQESSASTMQCATKVLAL